jgi:hypothetical protein
MPSPQLNVRAAPKANEGRLRTIVTVGQASLHRDERLVVLVQMARIAGERCRPVSSAGTLARSRPRKLLLGHAGSPGEVAVPDGAGRLELCMVCVRREAASAGGSLEDSAKRSNPRKVELRG